MREWPAPPPARFHRSTARPGAQPLRAQPPSAQPGPPAMGRVTDTQPKPPPLGAEDLDRLLEPFAGAPQDTLGVVLDACRYPNDLLDAARWVEQPEGTRGAAKDSWPPTVRLLAEQAPRTLDFLTRDLASTSALGSAYQNQPNDVWLAYGRVTTRQARPQPPRERAAEAGGADAKRSAAAGRAPAAPPAAAPRPAPSQQVAPSAATTLAAPPPQPAPQTVVVQPPASTGPSAAGAALAGGGVGLGAGLLISELAHDNDGWGRGYPPPYAVPPPYMPYAGGGGGAYNAPRDLQDSRISAARGLQADR